MRQYQSMIVWCHILSHHEIVYKKDVNINSPIVIAVGGAVVHLSLFNLSCLTRCSKLSQWHISLTHHNRIDKIISIKSSWRRMVSWWRFCIGAKSLDKCCRTSDVVCRVDIGSKRYGYEEHKANKQPRGRATAVLGAPPTKTAKRKFNQTKKPFNYSFQPKWPYFLLLLFFRGAEPQRGNL